mgnify:CR=1 FL=1
MKSNLKFKIVEARESLVDRNTKKNTVKCYYCQVEARESLVDRNLSTMQSAKHGTSRGSREPRGSKSVS